MDGFGFQSRRLCQAFRRTSGGCTQQHIHLFGLEDLENTGDDGRFAEGVSDLLIWYPLLEYESDQLWMGIPCLLKCCIVPTAPGRLLCAMACPLKASNVTDAGSVAWDAGGRFSWSIPTRGHPLRRS